jgi:hypothetical protein
MYHILDIGNGQPIILWQSGNNIQKYTINSGRIYNRGIILSDIHKNFKVWNTKPAYLSYESVDGSTVVCAITSDNTNEIFTSKSLSTFLNFNYKLYIFTLEHTGNEYTLFATTSDNFKEKKKICTESEMQQNILAISYQNYIIIFFKEKQIFLSPEMQIMMTLNTSATQNSSNINLQTEVSKLKFELHQLEQHHSDFVKEYDQLSAYTGELQEKLRKTRLNVKD